MSVKAVTMVSIVPALRLVAELVQRQHPGGAAWAARALCVLGFHDGRAYPGAVARSIALW